MDFTALNEAIAAFEVLKEANYTPDSWRGAKNYYDAAVDMKSGAYPQNAVTVAAWKLQDSIKELVPSDNTPEAAPEAAPAAGKKPLTVDKGIVAAAVATVVGAAAGLTFGIVKALKKRKK